MCKGLQDSMSSVELMVILRFDTGIWVAMEFLVKGFNCIIFTDALFSVAQVVSSSCCPTSDICGLEQHSRHQLSKTPSLPSSVNVAHRNREQHVRCKSPELLSSTLLPCSGSGSQHHEHRARCRLRSFSILSQ